MIEAAVPCHKTHAVFHIPEANYLGSFAPVSEPAAASPSAFAFTINRCTTLRRSAAARSAKEKARSAEVEANTDH